MKILDRIGLTLFSVLILIISILICLLILGWITPELVSEVIKITLNNPFATNTVLTISAICILLGLKCIFFSSEKQPTNGIKDGILLQNSDGQLIISKATLEELVNNIVKDFDSTEDATSKIVMDQENNLIVNVILSVKENAVIKELSNNLQTRIKSAIKKTSDLEVKEVNISIKDLRSRVQEKEV